MGLIEELTDEQIAQRIAALERTDTPQEIATRHFSNLYQAEDEVKEVSTKERYRYVRPLTEAADNLVEVFQNTEGRYMFGLKEIDLMMRGVGRGQLCYITGFAHSGKTQLFLGSVVANRHRRVVLFTPDETAEEVLTKLTCMITRSNAERMEERIKANDREAIDKLHRLARQEFKNLIVIDESLTLGQMADALKEAEDYWGERVDAVGFDYLELLRSEASDVETKSQELKRWTKDVDVPVLCLHQGSRGNSAGGQRLSMRSMKYGGEAEAIFVVGVRRKRDDESLDEWERGNHEDTVSIDVIKNKRPPSKKGEHDFYLDPECGLILPLQVAPQPTARQEEF